MKITRITVSIVPCLLFSAFAFAYCEPEPIEFESRGFKLKVSSYKPQASNGKKNIIIIPPTGGTNFLDRSYAENFCDAGFDAYILSRWSYDDEYSLDFRIHDRLYTRAMSAVRLMLANLEKGFVGVLGTSVGAIHAANAIQEFKQIDAVFLIAGGAPIAEVIANSKQDVLVEAREKRIEFFGITSLEGYALELKKNINYDPLGPTANSDLKTGMMIAGKDTIVPAKNQLDLKNALKPTYTIDIDADHKYSIIKTWLFYRDDIVSFFNPSSELSK